MRTRLRHRHTLTELILPWIITATILTLAWYTFQLPSIVPVSRVPTMPASAKSPGAAVRADATAQPPPSVMTDADVVELRKKHLSIPVAGVAGASLVSTFHQTRGGNREHEALAILAVRGTPAIAVEDSRVAKLFTSERGGLTVYLFDPSSTYCYYYAHLDRYADDLKEGDVVPRGHIVGYVGTTGNAPPQTPHLHFAVFKLGPAKNWWQGTPLDPYLIWR